ncbi:MAG: hypothetical protein WBO29_01700 [Albidovulum sp.]
MEAIKKQKQKGKLFVNKLSAAERQLAAAIRMYFMEEDPLAIHTVASAAYNLFADLLKLRGKDPSTHPMVYGLLRTAKDVVDGNLTEEDLLDWGDGALELLRPMIDLIERNPDLDLDEISVSASPRWARDFWSEKRKAYNFLKHADRDDSQLLDEADVNNEDIIFQAIGSSFHLNGRMTSEKEVFISAMYAFGHLKDPPLEPILIWVLMGDPREKIMALARKNLCYSRVDDDFDVDSEEGKNKAHALLSKMQEKETTRRKTKPK